MCEVEIKFFKKQGRDFLAEMTQKLKMASDSNSVRVSVALFTKVSSNAIKVLFEHLMIGYLTARTGASVHSFGNYPRTNLLYLTNIDLNV